MSLITVSRHLGIIHVKPIFIHVIFKVIQVKFFEPVFTNELALPYTPLSYPHYAVKVLIFLVLHKNLK